MPFHCSEHCEPASQRCIFHSRKFKDFEKHRKGAVSMNLIEYEEYRREVQEKFQQKIDNYFLNKSSEPLFCIGYNLYDISIRDKEFPNPVYFNDVKLSGSLSITDSKFLGSVSFVNSQFSGKGDINIASEFNKGRVDFSNSLFSNQGEVKFCALFLNKGEVNFSKSTFSNKGNVDFRGSLFSNKGDVNFRATNFSNKGDVYCLSVEFSNKGRVSFLGCEFPNKGDVWFVAARFSNKGVVDFTGAQFSNLGNVNFVETAFSNEGYLAFGAHFSNQGHVDFLGAQFSNQGYVSFGAKYSDIGPIDISVSVDLRTAQFLNQSHVSFFDTKFTNRGFVDFTDVQFSNKGDVSFTGANFSNEGTVGFTDAQYTNKGHVDFGAQYSDIVDDISATIPNISNIGKVNYHGTKFANKGTLDFGAQFYNDGKVSFTDAQFCNDGSVDFTNAQFCNDGSVDFTGSEFSGQTHFHSVEFKSVTLFRYVRFVSQNDIHFESEDLSNVSFANTDITRIVFHENTRFSKLESDKKRIKVFGKRRPKKFKIFKERRFERFQIYDERRFGRCIDKKELNTDSKLMKEGISLGTVLTSYRNLRENYEYTLRYEEAGQFFIREMELKRKYRDTYSFRKKKYIPKENRWLRRNFSFIGLYRNICNYGESSTRPLLLFGLIMFLSTAYWFTSSSFGSPVQDFLISNCNEPLIFCSLERTLSDIVGFPEKGIIIDYITRISSIIVLATLFLPFRRKFERRFRH
jgi:hypothetical protein